MWIRVTTTSGETAFIDESKITSVRTCATGSIAICMMGHDIEYVDPDEWNGIEDSRRFDDVFRIKFN